MMTELPDQADFERFASSWLGEVVAVFLRAVHDPALAYDLATETLAAARLRWTSASDDTEWFARLLDVHAAAVLEATVERGRVPSIDRRRAHQPSPHRLTVAEQRELTALAEACLDLPPQALAAAEGLARAAPPPHVLRGLRRSDLVGAEPLPDHPRDRHGR